MKYSEVKACKMLSEKDAQKLFVLTDLGEAENSEIYLVKRKPFWAWEFISPVLGNGFEGTKKQLEKCIEYASDGGRFDIGLGHVRGGVLISVMMAKI